MEKRLSEAAVQGNVTVLIEILDQDPLILDKIIVSCVSETPLHTAATLGHLNFVRELLSRKPELAAELDSRDCSPLHLAAAKGHVDVVKELLSADGEVGLVRNTEGMTALHLAAVKGRTAVLAELVRVKPEFTRALTDRAETGLHLCVKRNRVEALKLLGEEMQKDGEAEAVNSKDCDGNTPLHISVTNKHIEIINYLLSLNRLEVNSLNKNGLTALDILGQSPRGLRDIEIEHALRKAGASTVKDLHLITNINFIPSSRHQLSQIKKRPSSQIKPHSSTDWLGRKRSALMVVASLIATVAFQAGLTPPGGVWQDDYKTDENGNPVNNPHSVGQSIMANQEPSAYGVFMILNTIAFLSSLSIILILVSGLPLNRRRWMWFQMVIMWIAITAQVGTYFVTFRNMTTDDVQGMLREVTEISVLTWMTLMGVVFIGNVVRMNLWVLRKYGIIKPKERRSEVVVEDDGEEL